MKIEIGLKTIFYKPMEQYLAKTMFILHTKLINLNSINRLGLGLYLCLVSSSIFAQNIDLKEAVVTAYREKISKLSSVNISAIGLDSLHLLASYNLSEQLAKEPGISMLTTGIAIAKPVIRGLYGNRILVLLSGLKFDNQQWQEEHGLGLTSFGLSKVELIKGPIGILYGTEAIGGLINLIEEKPAQPGTEEHDYGLNFNSNTLGGTIQAGYKTAKENSWWRIRAAIENNGDYSDGNGKRVLNSRFDGYYLKAAYGFRRGNWESENSFSSSFNRYGFIFNDIYTFITPDKRSSRHLNENPAHLVILNLVNSTNKIKLQNGAKLAVNLGVQSNKRLENEGGGAISLNMHLLTFQALLKYEKALNEKHKLIVSHLNSIEDNTNYGARKIVPDAILQESNVGVYLESILNPKLILENGGGFGEKIVKTYFTPTVNSSEKEISPFSKTALYANVYSGFTYLPNKNFNIKLNLATGVRIANLAELSANGLHEGVFTYEIGDPNLKNEQIYSANTYVNYSVNKFQFSVSPFYNLFTNYIYLAPTNEDWFGFPVYRYKQQGAKQFGGEVQVGYTLNSAWQSSVAYSGMVSKTSDGYYTPFQPAKKLVPKLAYTFTLKDKNPMHAYGEYVYNFAQYHSAPFERGTPNYSLLNAGIKGDFKLANTMLSCALSVNNLLNTAYYDNLSRFKNFDLLNIGRNVSLNLKLSY